jgi:hypothetical protein
MRRLSSASVLLFARGLPNSPGEGQSGVQKAPSNPQCRPYRAVAHWVPVRAGCAPRSCCLKIRPRASGATLAWPRGWGWVAALRAGPRRTIAMTDRDRGVDRPEGGDWIWRRRRGRLQSGRRPGGSRRIWTRVYWCELRLAAPCRGQAGNTSWEVAAGVMELSVAMLALHHFTISHSCLSIAGC